MKLYTLLLILCSTVAVAQTKDEKAVATQVDALKKAMIDGDKKALESLVDDHLSYGHSGGKIEDKPTFVDNIVSGKSDFVTMDITNQTIYVTGTTAIVTHDIDANTNDSGKPGNVKLHILLVWVKEGGAWKLLARQAVHK
jgi:hypothetical protein